MATAAANTITATPLKRDQIPSSSFLAAIPILAVCSLVPVPCPYGSSRSVCVVCAATAAGVKGSANVVPLYQSFHWSRKYGLSGLPLSPSTMFSVDAVHVAPVHGESLRRAEGAAHLLHRRWRRRSAAARPVPAMRAMSGKNCGERVLDVNHMPVSVAPVAPHRRRLSVSIPLRTAAVSSAFQSL